MSATEMELRVAEAICGAFKDAAHEDCSPFLSVDDITHIMADGRFDARILARAAIRAMREPTAEMCEEVTGMFMGSDIRRMAASTFRRMIDVASPAKPLPDAPQGALPK